MLPRSTREALGMVAPRRSYTEKEKQPLYKKQRGLCNGCRETFALRNLTLDHIKSLNSGGKDVPRNWQLLCGYCNSLKGDGTQAQLAKRLAAKKVIKVAKPKAAAKTKTTKAPARAEVVGKTKKTANKKPKEARKSTIRKR